MFHRQPPCWAADLLCQMAQIQQQIGSLMSAVSVDQAVLDTLATNLEAVKTSLATEIANLQQQLPAANLAGLNQALADLQALEPPVV